MTGWSKTCHMLATDICTLRRPRVTKVSIMSKRVKALKFRSAHLETWAISIVLVTRSPKVSTLSKVSRPQATRLVRTPFPAQPDKVWLARASRRLESWVRTHKLNERLG